MGGPPHESGLGLEIHFRCVRACTHACMQVRGPHALHGDCAQSSSASFLIGLLGHRQPHLRMDPPHQPSRESQRRAFRSSSSYRRPLQGRCCSPSRSAPLPASWNLETPSGRRGSTSDSHATTFTSLWFRIACSCRRCELACWGVLILIHLPSFSASPAAPSLQFPLLNFRLIENMCRHQKEESGRTTWQDGQFQKHARLATARCEVGRKQETNIERWDSFGFAFPPLP